MSTFLTQFVNGVLDPDQHKEMKEFVLGRELPWTFLEDTTMENSRKVGRDTPAFAHLLLGNDGYRSPYLDKFTPIYQNIIDRLGVEPKSVFRMRLGFLMNTRYNYPSEPYAFNLPHRDADIDHLTAVYYFWHSDGNTVIFNQTEESEKYTVKESIQPEGNMAVVFDGRQMHASTCPKIHHKRVALTINFTV